MKLHGTACPRILVSLALVVSAACGDGRGAVDAAPPDTTPDAPPLATAQDFDGFWLIRSMTLAVGGNEITYRRDGTPLSMRADSLFQATDDTHGTLDHRQVLLENGLMADDMYTVVKAVTVDGPVLLFEEPDGDVQVYSYQLDGDQLTLTWDPEDPRNVGQASPPLVIESERVAPWGSDSVGSWGLVSIVLSELDDPVTPDTCIELVPGTAWGRLDTPIEITDRLIFTRTLIVTTYSDDACTIELGAQTTVQNGFAEEEAGVVRIWIRDVGDGEPEYVEFTMSLEGDVLTLTYRPGTCLPTPDCETSVPGEVIVERVGSAARKPR